jgi:adenylyltransferase/sulfurtransferase
LLPKEFHRYERQILLNGVGEKGQRELRSSKVLIVGVGGLGSPALLYLAAAGIGALGILDADSVELENLQRQILHSTSRIGERKTTSARKALLDLNPEVDVTEHSLRLSAANALDLVDPYDLIVDACDNFPTRYALNAACVTKNRPLIHAGVLAFRGQMMVILPYRGPCFQCVFPEPPDEKALSTTSEVGILGPVAGTLGTLLATEAIKVLLGIGKPLVGRLLTYDGLEGTFRTVRVHRNPQCPVCGEASLFP